MVQARMLPIATIRTNRTRIAVGHFVLLCGLASASVSAQSLVDEGWTRYSQAEFESATEAFDAAEARGGLSRDDLVRLLEGRALVTFAQDDPSAMHRALRMLADLDPQHALSPDAPPEIARAFIEARRQAGEPVRISLDLEEVPGGARLMATVSGDDDGLVIDVRIFARADDDTWQHQDGSRLDVLQPELRQIEAYVEAVGPGGAVVARRGSVGSPLRFSLEGPVIAPRPRPRPRKRNIIIGASAAGVAILALVIGVVVARSGTQTQPGVPRVVGLRP